jgi:hypothetical protein
MAYVFSLVILYYPVLSRAWEINPAHNPNVKVAIRRDSDIGGEGNAILLWFLFENPFQIF